MSETGWANAPERQPALRRTPVAQLFEDTFRLYRQAFATMLIVFGAFQVPLVVVNVQLALLQAHLTQLQLEHDPFLSASPDWSVYGELVGGFVIIGLVTIFLVFIIGTFGAAAISHLAGVMIKGGQPSAVETFRELLRLAPRLLGFGAIFIAAVLGIVMGVAVLVVADLSLLIRSPGIAIGFLVLLAVALSGLLLVVGARLALAIPALVLEGRAPAAAIGRSWSLVSGSTWRVIGVLYLAGLLLAVIGGIVPTLLPGGYAGIATGSPAPFVRLALASGAVQLILGPILPILTTVLYYDLAGRSAHPN